MAPTLAFARDHQVDLPEVQEVLSGFRAVTDAYDARVLVGEAYLPLDKVVAYYGARARPGVVIGRRVRPLDAIVELTVLTTQVRVAGYAPSSLISSRWARWCAISRRTAGWP